MTHDCGCSGSSQPIIVNCGKSTDTGKPDDSGGNDADSGNTGNEGDDGGQHESPTPSCSVASVQFKSIRVGNSAGVGAFGVELDEGWNLVMEVNGDSVEDHFQAKDGLFRPLSEDPITVDLPNTSSRIRVHVSGRTDSLGGDIFAVNLPSATLDFGSAEDWGLGTTQTIDAGDDDRDYSVTFSIKCQTAAVQSFFSRQAAVKIVREQLAPLGERGRVSDETALSIFVHYFNRKGYKLKDIQPDMLMWEGARPIQGAVGRLLQASKARQGSKHSE